MNRCFLMLTIIFLLLQKFLQASMERFPSDTKYTNQKQWIWNEPVKEIILNGNTSATIHVAGHQQPLMCEIENHRNIVQPALPFFQDAKLKIGIRDDLKKNKVLLAKIRLAPADRLIISCHDNAVVQVRGNFTILFVRTYHCGKINLYGTSREVYLTAREASSINAATHFKTEYAYAECREGAELSIAAETGDLHAHDLSWIFLYANNDKNDDRKFSKSTSGMAKIIKS